MDNKHIKIREILVGLIFMILFGLIAARAVQVQVYDGPWLSKKASDQYEKSLTTYGRRGTIYDRNFREMAISVEVPSIAAYPKQISEKKATARALANVLKMTASEVSKKLTSTKQFVWIKRQTTPKEVEAVKKLELKGIGFVRKATVSTPTRHWRPRRLVLPDWMAMGWKASSFFTIKI